MLRARFDRRTLRKSHVVVWALAATAAILAACNVSAADDNSIVPAGATLELLYTRSAPIKAGLTEGPAVAPDGSIYFTDIPEGADDGLIVRYDPKSGKSTIFTDKSGKANGLAFDAQGRLLACEGSDGGGRCLSRWDIKTKKREVLADGYQGKRFNSPNDLCLDAEGRVYFTDPKYLGSEKRELEHRAVYRWDPDGTVHELTHEVEKPNGIALSPDGRTLYVIDHNNGSDNATPDGPPPKKGAMKVYAFPLGPDAKVNGPRRTLVDFGQENGCDGMTVDVDGNLYLTARSLARPGLLVLDPQGKELAFMATAPPQPGAKMPVGLPSNCEFGIGPESRTLYITIDKSLYRIGLKKEGFRLPNKK